MWIGRGIGDGASYTGLQIALHWLVLTLVMVQWATSDAMGRTNNPFLPPKPADLLEQDVHIACGVAIAALMLLRLVLHLRHRTPLSSGAGWKRALAAAVHCGFYAVLLAQASTGFVAAYLWSGAGRLHAIGWTIILALIALHIVGALYSLIASLDRRIACGRSSPRLAAPSARRRRRRSRQ